MSAPRFLVSMMLTSKKSRISEIFNRRESDLELWEFSDEYLRTELVGSAVRYHPQLVTEEVHRFIIVELRKEQV